MKGWGSALPLRRCRWGPWWRTCPINWRRCSLSRALTSAWAKGNWCAWPGPSSGETASSSLMRPQRMWTQGQGIVSTCGLFTWIVFFVVIKQLLCDYATKPISQKWNIMKRIHSGLVWHNAHCFISYIVSLELYSTSLSSSFTISIKQRGDLIIVSLQ